jgi:cytochrome c5
MRAPTIVGAAILSIGAACATARLPAGERLVRNKCSSCHAAPRAGKRAPTTWSKVLDDHRRRMDLSEKQRRLLLDHLSSSGKDRQQGLSVK